MITERRITLSSGMLVLALALLVFFLGVSLLNFWNLAQMAVAFPYPLDYGEGPLLDQVMRLAQGENIYHNDFSIPPYTLSNYPPLFMLAQVPFAWAAGPAFWYGRLISIFAALITAVLIGLTLYTLTDDWMAASIGGILFLVYPYIQYWAVLDRIDLLAQVLSWAGIFAAVRWRDRRWGIPAAALFFIAAIFTRQTYALAGPAGVFVWLLIIWRKRQAFLLAGLTGGASLLLFLLINILTRGGFALNIITANVNPFLWQTVKHHMEELSNNSFILLILVGIFLIAERTGKPTRTWPLALPYLIAATLGAITIGKDGSNVNYLLEMTGAICFASGAAFAWLGRSTWLRVVVLVALVFQVNALTEWTRAGYNVRITEKIDQEQEISRLFALVRESNGIVLADEYMGLLPLAGKRLYYQPFEYKMLAEGGIWDEKPFLEAIKSNEYGLILQYQPPTWQAVAARWTPAMRTTIRTYYKQERIVAYNWVFHPKKQGK